MFMPIVELKVPADMTRPMTLTVVYGFPVVEKDGHPQYELPARELVAALREKAPGAFVDALRDALASGR